MRANRTRAEAIAGDGEVLLDGHKWFCSAPMSDAFLVLAQEAAGLSCFLMPRFRPDGRLNGMRIQRLKDKLGNRSNASSEIEFQRAWARRVGEPGRGVAAILEMVRHTRLDCVIGAAATMRRAVAEATHHGHHRRAFGRALEDQPLMGQVLADLCLESEAATALALHLARVFDRSAEDPDAARLARLLTPVAKFHVTRRAVTVVAEALECIGGNGYVEEHPVARLYREAPLNSLWEGAGNIQCLDLLRTLGRDPGVIEVLRAELRPAVQAEPRLGDYLVRLESDLAAAEPASARRLAEGLATAVQASLMVQAAPPALADAFVASRLGAGIPTLGTLPRGLDLEEIVRRGRPNRD